MSPGKVDLLDEYTVGRRNFNLFEPDRSDVARFEDSGDADLTGELSVLNYGCHAGDYERAGLRKQGR